MSKTKNIHVCSYDVVCNKTHKLSSFFKYFQQIATEDLDAVGLSYDTLLERNMVFVLAKMKAVFYRPIFDHEDLILSSSHRRIKGASFIRDYVLKCGEDVVAEASSYWALIDVVAHRLLRPSVIENELKESEALCSFEIDDRFVFPEGVDVAEHPYTVVFSDIDQNHHMNNTRYPDICMDAVCDVSEDSYVREIRIDYLNEVKKSEELLMKYTPEAVDGAYYFSSSNQTTGAKCFDAIIRFGSF